ncbi:hypothetical protein [Methylobacterium nigriterrae]|uniref:hypothetical protein n=1 Tax=Methylobacterium nigriterrae TaxID=3127512 RepID=UPI003013D683
MACSYSDFAEPTHPRIVKRLKGRGRLLSASLDPLRVECELFVGKTQFGLHGYGLLRGDPEALTVRWLIPDIVLRLDDGRRLELSITDLSGKVARVEMITIPRWLVQRRRDR